MVHMLRRYSYSDRVRYYWNAPQALDAVQKLMTNLRDVTIPETLLSAYLPEQYHAVRAGRLQPRALPLILDSIRTVLRPYASACNACDLILS